MRRILIITVPIVLAAIVAFVVVFVQNNASSTSTNARPNYSSMLNAAAQQNSNQAIVETEQQDPTELVYALCRLFAERFGSSSSQYPAKPYTAVMPFATASLKNVLERLSLNPPKLPEGQTIEAKAIAFNLNSLDAQKGRAVVQVTVQQVRHSAANDATTYVRLQLQLIREQDAWKVNSAAYQ
jgi:hypothetical protein